MVLQGLLVINFPIWSLRHAPCTNGIFTLLQFTFASNAATIVGGCLVTNRYKLRLPAAFVSAFVISVSIHMQFVTP